MKGKVLSEWRQRASVDPLDLIIAQEDEAERLAGQDVNANALYARLFEVAPPSIIITALQQKGLWPGRPSPWALKHLRAWQREHNLERLYHYVKEG